MIPSTGQFDSVSKPQAHSTSGSSNGSAGGHGSAIASPSSKEVSF